MFQAGGVPRNRVACFESLACVTGVAVLPLFRYFRLSRGSCSDRRLVAPDASMIGLS